MAQGMKMNWLKSAAVGWVIVLGTCLVLLGLLAYVTRNKPTYDFGVLNDGSATMHDVRFAYGDRERTLGNMDPGEGISFGLYASEFVGVSSVMVRFQDGSDQEHRSSQPMVSDPERDCLQAVLDKNSNLTWRTEPRLILQR
jgi:hypothetical protein